MKLEHSLTSYTRIKCIKDLNVKLDAIKLSKKKKKRICLQCRRPMFNPWVKRISWRREWQSTPVFLPGEFCGQRNLVGYSLWGPKELDVAE